MKKRRRQSCEPLVVFEGEVMNLNHLLSKKVKFLDHQGGHSNITLKQLKEKL